ncbi:MAG: MarR family transcriptional regulator [Bacteroidia bacterium]|nr:MarR family transcriptional regulator [Bacteroidia bacterium]
MNIEEEIKQSKFRNQRIKALINITFTSNYIELELKNKIEPYGITIQQFNVLRILRGQYPAYVSNTIIKERMIDKMPDTSRLIDRLEAKGYVEKHKCKKDRRLVDIRISEAGLSILKEIDSVETTFEDLLMLTESEAELLNQLLDKIRNK